MAERSQIIELFQRRGLDAGLISRRLIEMIGPVLTRALQPFPISVRTLDAIHPAALEFVRAQRQSVQLGGYDKRLVAAARLLGIEEWSERQ